MPRPSRNIDQLLIAAALELLPNAGTSVLTIRQVCQHAGVNLGMFHYHFKTRDVFLRAVLQQMYDGMFATLAIEVERQSSPLDSLRAAVTTLARFARDHRQLLVRLVNDAIGGERVAIEFLQGNLPRHIGLLSNTIAAAQREGLLRPVPPLQAFAFLVGAVAASMLIGSAVAESGLMPPPLEEQFAASILTDAAIDERVDMALAGLALPLAKMTKSGARK